MNISVAALVPELTDDYDERSSLSAYRLAIGNLLGFCSLMVMTQILETYDSTDIVDGYRNSSFVVAIIMASLGILCFTFIREKFKPVVHNEYEERAPPTDKHAKMVDSTDSRDSSSSATGPRTRKASSISFENRKFKDELKLVLENKAFLWLSGIWLCGPTAMYVRASEAKRVLMREEGEGD